MEFDYKNRMIGFAYKFNEGGKVNLAVGVSAGDFSVRYAVSADPNGGNGIWGQRDEANKGAFTFNKELEVNANDVLFVLLTREDEVATCTFSITVTKAEEAVEPQPENVISSFGKDFANTLVGQGNWRVGTMDYQFSDGEPFTFTQITNKDDNALLYDNGKITANTVEFDYKNRMIGFAYKFNEGGKVNLAVGVSAGDFSVRYAVSADPNGGNGIWGQRDEANKGAFTFNKELEVNANDVLFVLLTREDEVATCTFSITLTKVEEAVEPQPFAGANFGDDFADTLEGKGNWKVGTAAYEYSDDSFTFTQFTGKNDDGNGLLNRDPWIEVHEDWMAVNGMMVLAYRFDSEATVKFDFALISENGKFSVRWALGTESGGNGHWGGDPQNNMNVSEELQVTADSVLYILVNKEEGSGTDQCHFSFTISDNK